MDVVRTGFGRGTLFFVDFIAAKKVTTAALHKIIPTNIYIYIYSVIHTRQSMYELCTEFCPFDTCEDLDLDSIYNSFFLIFAVQAPHHRCRLKGIICSKTDPMSPSYPSPT